MSAALTWNAAWGVRRFAMRLVPNNRAHSSPYTKSTQVIGLLGDRWWAQFEMPANSYLLAQRIESIITQLRGADGTMALWHLARPAPTGTMRGTPTLSGAVAQGAMSLPITTTAGATLIQGDMLGLAGQLVMVATDATANGAGAITVPITHPLRAAVSSGTAVVWDKPSVVFRQQGDEAASPVDYRRGRAEPVQFTFLEGY